MKRIKIVHWDDDPLQRVDILTILNRAFGASQIEYVFYSYGITELEDLLINKKEPFDLLIMDLFDQHEKLVGNIILKQLPADAKVIVLTQHADATTQSTLNDNVIKVKFQTLYKSNTSQEPEKYFIPEVEQKTGLKKIANVDFELNWDKNDVNADYQVSIIGDDHLTNLVNSYLTQYYPDNRVNRVTIYPIVAGYSGALVFNVLIELDENPELDILLKVDKAKQSLDLELKSANGTLYKHFKDYRVEYDKILLDSEIKGFHWHGLTADFISRGQTVKKMILSSPKYEDVELVLETLFSKCLTKTYQRNPAAAKETHIIYPIHNITKILDKKKKAFLFNTLKELAPLLEGSKNDALINIFNFDSNEKTLDKTEAAEYKKLVLVHGDLHGSNIMVSETGVLKIIDPANMQYDHWTRDICMLIVDIFAYCIDYQEKEYFGVSKIPKWRGMGERLFLGKEIQNENKNDVACKSISNLSNFEYLKNKLGFSPWFEIWEFQLSLVMEFLRISYKSNQLPAGKRAACMLIALDGFEKVKESYNTFKTQKK